MEKGLKVALGIISGRLDFTELDENDLNALGFDETDIHLFRYNGNPTKEEMLVLAEEILYRAIQK